MKSSMNPSLKKRMFRSLSAIAVLGALLGGSVPAQARRAKRGTATATAAAPSTDCKKDSDCVLVPDECCSCSEGGKQHAIFKGERDAYEKERKKRCAGTVCMAMMSEDPSCAKRPFCGAGICELDDPPAPKPPEEPAKEPVKEQAKDPAKDPVKAAPKDTTKTP